MIYLIEGQNTPAATCSRNKSLTGSVSYLWSMKHKLSGQIWRFVPYQLPPTLTNPSYDLFSVKIDYDNVEVLTGATTTGQTNVHLIEGEYWLKIYEQSSTMSGNLNPSLAYDYVYETIVDVSMSASTKPISYSGTTDIYKIYEG
jgi:hypothetical protein